VTARLAGEAVFVPGDPGRLGALALYDIPGDIPGDAPRSSIELVLPTAKSVRRRTVPARLVP
jgi:hypothetical protein